MGQFVRLSERERREKLDEIKALLASGRVEEARVNVLKYLEREKTEEGNFLAGMVSIRQGDIHSAYRYLKEALRLNPDYYEARQQLAELYLAVGNFKSALEETSFLKKSDSFRNEGFLIEAEISILEGKLEEAVSKIETAVEEGKKRGTLPPVLLIHQAGIYAARGNLRRAKEIVDTVDRKKLDPTGHLALARYYKIAREEEKIAPLLKEAIGSFPGNPELLYYYALELFRLGNYTEASGIFKKVYEVMPNSRVAAYRYGQSLLASGQLDEAGKIITEILKRSPSDILGLSLKARHQLLRKDTKGAIDTLKKTIALVPEAPRPHTLIGEIYWHEGIFSLAEKYARAAITLGEKSLSPRFILGDIYMKQGRYKEAIDHYSSILEREPQNVIALSQLTDAYANVGNVKQAVLYLDKILLHYPRLAWMERKKELLIQMQKGPVEMLETAQKHAAQNPMDARAQMAYVQALILNNRLDEAVSVLQGALKREPRNQWYLITLGDLLIARGNVTEATDIFDRAVKLNPKDINLLINIGGRFEKINLDKKAEDLYVRAYGQDKENLVVLNQLAWFYVEAVGDLEKARPYIEILRLKGEGAYEKDTIGWYYYKRDDFSSAEGFFREALHLDGANNVIRAHYALTLYKLGKVKQAEGEKNKVISIMPAGRLREELIKVAGEVRK
ncbi:MAG: tetratricopeptide repeat protein [Syntrophales bacterium]|nr:tetratricopeptide repeat protein [Syntrophales bacterium]